MFLDQLKRYAGVVCTVAAFGFFAGHALAQQRFQLHSSTFTRDGVMPISTIFNNISNGVNACSASGAAGGDQSPQLYWTGAPEGTRSFVVVLYDRTAAFTHWGMYNIDGNLNQLPANAGVAGSAYGQQIMNDFYAGQEYDGPCPPANLAPDTHRYVFTIYALRSKLRLPQSANFPANAETLDQALIKAGEDGDILGKASLTGLYSSTPPSSTTNK